MKLLLNIEIEILLNLITIAKKLRRRIRKNILLQNFPISRFDGASSKSNEDESTSNFMLNELKDYSRSNMLVLEQTDSSSRTKNDSNDVNLDDTKMSAVEH